MQTIQIDLPDKNLEPFLNILSNFKDGFFDKISIKDDNDLKVDIEKSLEVLHKIESGQTSQFRAVTPEELFKELDF
jgi:hypothetical protein